MSDDNWHLPEAESHYMRDVVALVNRLSDRIIELEAKLAAATAGNMTRSWDNIWCFPAVPYVGSPCYGTAITSIGFNEAADIPAETVEEINRIYGSGCDTITFAPVQPMRVGDKITGGPLGDMVVTDVATEGAEVDVEEYYGDAYCGACGLKCADAPNGCARTNCAHK